VLLMLSFGPLASSEELAYYDLFNRQGFFISVSFEPVFLTKKLRIREPQKETRKHIYTCAYDCLFHRPNHSSTLARTVKRECFSGRFPWFFSGCF
jgi:hypothetical protein